MFSLLMTFMNLMHLPLNPSSTSTGVSDYPVNKKLTIVIDTSSWDQNRPFKHDLSLISGFAASVNENTIKSFDCNISDFCNC